jgi:hypothetical protein
MGGRQAAFLLKRDGRAEREVPSYGIVVSLRRGLSIVMNVRGHRVIIPLDRFDPILRPARRALRVARSHSPRQ